MTKDEFQKKYHDYAVENEMDALGDALELNAKNDFKVVPVKLGDKYCLMLEEAASLIHELGI